MQRVNPSDEIDTVAYAVSFMKAAKRLAETEEEWEDNHSLIVPFYMLIGFSLENALKAVLEFNGSDPGTKWSHSHDLQRLRLLAEHHGGNRRDHHPPERAMDAANGSERDYGGMRYPSRLSLSPA